MRTQGFRSSNNTLYGFVVASPPLQPSFRHHTQTAATTQGGFFNHDEIERHTEIEKGRRTGSRGREDSRRSCRRTSGSGCPASLVLVKFAERWLSSTSTTDNPYATVLLFHNKRAIELGTGCGVAAMGVYLLGLKDVVLTDIAPVMPALKHNLKRNKTVLGKMLKMAQLHWTNSEQIKALKPPFDIVIAADVVYIEES
ncbi:hypothetical protein LXL04_002002 [Taraxacum kok-saghyz]